MNIRVRQFAVRHNGKLYKTGEVFEVSDEAGEKLVAESNGELEELPGAPTKQAENSEETGKENGEEAGQENGGENSGDEETGTEQPGGGLDPVDPAKTVKGKK